jgi:hypothetical protein
MDTACKAMLTAITVAAVLLAARVLGRRAAGLLAGLPVITLPALVWLVHDQGTDFAAHSAVGSLAACAMAPLFAAAYQALATRWGAAGSLAGAACVGAGATLALHALERWPLLLLVAALAGSRLVRRHSLQRRPAHAAVALPRPLAGEPWVTAATAGAVSAAVAWLATALGPYWAGVLATLPLISACALVHLHVAAGRTTLPGFVGGYAVGIGAKALFVYGFVVAAPILGAAGAFAAAALAGAAGAWLLSHSWPPAARPLAPAQRAR